jgi:putative transposase
MSTMKSKERREDGAEHEQDRQDVIDRLAGLLPEDVSGPGGLLSQLAGRVIEAALQAEMTEQVGHPPGAIPSGSNRRNGSTPKTLATDLGPVGIPTPRDREGSFEPRLVAKSQTRMAGLDEKILSLYAGGMSVRDISAHLSEIYGTDRPSSRRARGGARGTRTLDLLAAMR